MNNYQMKAILFASLLLSQAPVMANWEQSCAALDPLLPNDCAAIQATVTDLNQFQPPAPFFTMTLTTPTPASAAPTGSAGILQPPSEGGAGSTPSSGSSSGWQ